MNLGFEARHVSVRSLSGARWQAPPRILRARLVILLLCLDLFSIVASIWISAALIGGGNEQVQATLGVVIPVYLLGALNARAYDAEVIQRPIRAATRAGRAFLVASLMAIVIAFSLKVSSEFSRLTAGCAFGLGLAVLVCGRIFAASSAVRILGGNPFSTVLIVDGEQDVPDGEYSTIIASDGYFDPSSDDPRMYDKLAKTLDHANRVVVVCDETRRTVWAHALKGANIQGEILVPELRHLAPLGVELHGSTPAMIVSYGPLQWGDRAIKRAFDLVIAGFALLALAPLFGVIALLIKLHDGGPVFFVQTRIGRSNKLFSMYKFRSMRIAGCDSDGNQSTQRDDDRVTPIGRLIRSTSIDELAQLINVLIGDMSIVGPRPHATGSRAADKLFWEVDRRYWHRHSTKPGLTGLAQVRGYRGATQMEVDLVNRLQADLEYIDHWSIWRDLKIIVMTFGVLLHRNAY